MLLNLEHRAQVVTTVR